MFGTEKALNLMKRLIVFMLVFSFFIPTNAHMEKHSLKIIVTNENDSLNYQIEEAFFMFHPDTDIEYILYTEDQLFSHLLAGTTDADLVILPYHILVSMEEKGYLAYLDDAAGLTSYPEQMIDISTWLTKNDKLFALPVSISQNSWYWNEKAGESIGLEYPGDGAWSWEDYAKLADQFPYDSDQDGKADTYIMYGSSNNTYPALKNANIEMLVQYLVSYQEFDTFRQKYLDLFRQIVVDDALLNINTQSTNKQQVLLGVNGYNPIASVDHTSIEDDGYILFMPPPTLDGKDGPYFGYLNACAILKNAVSPDLAADYIRVMASEEALNYTVFGLYDNMLSKALPEAEYYIDDDSLLPVFISEGSFPVYRISSDRPLMMIEFTQSEKAFEIAQRYRSKLIVNAFPFGRDFYDAAFAAVQEWIYGNIDDDGLTERMNFLLGIAENRR